MAWSRGVWFLLGKPFVLQKWHPKFKPKKEDFSSVLIWVKIHDLPLACWNSEGISRIASKIGVPIAADNLTEQKTRLTFARICVLVDCNATYPDEIRVSLDGDVVSLAVQYEWRPYPCEHCKSLMHFSSTCPSKPSVDTVVMVGKATEENINRGRSFSRNHRSRKQSNSHKNSRPPVSNLVAPTSLNINQESSLNKLGGDNSMDLNSDLVFAKHPSQIGKNLHYQPNSPKPQNTAPPILVPSQIPLLTEFQYTEDAIVTNIPNLNSPNDVASSSNSVLNNKSSPKQKYFISPNKFDALNIEEESTSHTEVLPESDNTDSEIIVEKEQLNNHKAGGKVKTQQLAAASKKSAKGKQVKKSLSQSKS
ncbi:hypothetical protein KFK09_014250 [Dendrobium nobile]|uniref:DUF4283 domain-containing protein n=1 Tax=Dendrobium nobile TaxID=94219 RepID=A0A8T3BCF2_DENNO|nr:hypothetical protein KFK09_014250 [Dendrobium nobile]